MILSLLAQAVPRLTSPLPREAKAVSRVLSTSAQLSSDVAMASEEMAPEEVDELILRIAQERDLGALKKIHHHFMPKLMAYMLRTLDDQVSAKEASTEAMTRIWKEASVFRRSGKDGLAWIFTIARDVRLEATGRRKRPHYASGDEVVRAGSNFEIVQCDRSAADHRKAVKSYREDEAEILRMSYCEDMSISNIAATLNMSLETVRSRVRVACKKLL